MNPSWHVGWAVGFFPSSSAGTDLPSLTEPNPGIRSPLWLWRMEASHTHLLLLLQTHHSKPLNGPRSFCRCQRTADGSLPSGTSASVLVVWWGQEATSEILPLPLLLLLLLLLLHILHDQECVPAEMGVEVWCTEEAHPCLPPSSRLHLVSIYRIT